MFCPYCGTPLDDDALTCTACNAPVEPLKITDEPEVKTEPEIAEEVPVSAAPVKKHTRLPRILFGILGIAAALAAVVALAIYLLPILAGKGPATALYVKDNELFTTRLAKLQPWQVTDKLIDASNTELGSMSKNTYAGLLSDYTYLTRDGRTLFYPDKYTPGDNGVTIYYRNIKNPEEAPKKLDSNIVHYTVSPDGERVVYLKSDGTLFRYNAQGKEKVATGLPTNYNTPFYTSEDCKNLIFLQPNSDNAYTVYAQTEGGEKLRLTADCTVLQYITNDCTAVYYTNSKNTLYKVTTALDKQKIAYDVSKVFFVYETGELYYAICDPDEPIPLTASQFVTDDAQGDVSKDALRQELAAAEFSANYANAICYYDGKEAHTLGENCIFSLVSDYAASIPYAVAADTATLVFSYCDVSNVTKVQLSQVADMSELWNKIAENVSGTNKVFVAVKNTVTELTCEGKGVTAKDICITNDGKTAYYLAKSDSDALMGGLYKFAIAEGKPQAAELYDTDVYTLDILDNNTVLYYCDVAEDRDKGDLYVNQSLVDYDVPIGGYQYDSDNRWLLYFIDMDKTHTSGTLKLWDDGDSVKIADEVFTFVCIDDEVLYLTDYDADKEHGTLYLFQNDASSEVDTEVSHIIGSNDDFGFVFRKMYAH